MYTSAKSAAFASSTLNPGTTAIVAGTIGSTVDIDSCLRTDRGTIVPDDDDATGSSASSMPLVVVL